MFRKIVSLMLAVLLFTTANLNIAYARSNEERDARLAAKVKEGVSKLGVGKEAQVEVKMRNKTKLNGYISEAGEDSFVVINAKTGESNTVTYPSVKQIKGNNHSLGVKIAIGVAIVAAVFVALIILIELGFRERNCTSTVFGEC